MEDSKNGINHKCPCCGYEVEYDWYNDNYINGDESFVRINNPVGKTGNFETDIQNDNYYNDTKVAVILLGCPKCGCVSYKFW